MSFAHAPVCKGAMMVLGVTSLVVSVFDLKHYVHLQITPHLARDHQYWRVIVQPLAYASSAELFLAQLLVFTVCIQVERLFGSYRFASFLFVSTIISSALCLALLVVLRAVGSNINMIPSGPTAVLLSNVYQFSRIVPASYRLKVGGFVMSNKVFHYVLAVQLALSHWPESLLATSAGIVVGQLYRADVVGLKSYRLPPRVFDLLARMLSPIIGSMRPPRRSVLAMPGESTTPIDSEVVRTQRQTDTAASAPSVVTQWVNELTSRQTNLRRPSEDEISQLQGMFPSVPRAQVVSALQQSPNVERAVEVLLGR
ncbi:hypothetical protein BKA62DRAFT_690366 [Auriculariales sp. MPI-PUGE-AT-0066]|nr:hypothetical protein BKA62DRAFT_690366 [Auriculariales sp. MPI-PUGE-AT-0066]